MVRVAHRSCLPQARWCHCGSHHPRPAVTHLWTRSLHFHFTSLHFACQVREKTQVTGHRTRRRVCKTATAEQQQEGSLPLKAEAWRRHTLSCMPIAPPVALPPDSCQPAPSWRAHMLFTCYHMSARGTSSVARARGPAAASARWQSERAGGRARVRACVR